MIVFVAKQTLDGETSALKELAKVEALALEVLLSGAFERTRISGSGIGIFFKIVLGRNRVRIEHIVLKRVAYEHRVAFAVVRVDVGHFEELREDARPFAVAINAIVRHRLASKARLCAAQARALVYAYACALANHVVGA